MERAHRRNETDPFAGEAMRVQRRAQVCQSAHDTGRLCHRIGCFCRKFVNSLLTKWRDSLNHEKDAFYTFDRLAEIPRLVPDV
jgi:hypothetical protein